MSDRSKALILYADDVEIIVDTVTPWISMTGVADPDRGLGTGLSPECWRQMGDACRRAADRQEAIERGTPESITAPADSTKPMACGACGEVDGLSLRVMTGPGRVKVACPCGAEGPHVTTAEAPGDFVAMQRLALARWNRMWAPRAGEATKRVAAAIRNAIEGWEDRDWLCINHESGFGEEIDRSDAVAMLAELGLAGGEGRG